MLGHINLSLGLTHDTVDEDEDKVEKDDEAERAQEDNTVDRVDLHPAFFGATSWKIQQSLLLDILKDDEVICTWSLTLVIGVFPGCGRRRKRSFVEKFMIGVLARLPLRNILWIGKPMTPSSASSFWKRTPISLELREKYKRTLHHALLKQHLQGTQNFEF